MTYLSALLTSFQNDLNIMMRIQPEYKICWAACAEDAIIMMEHS